MKRFLTFLCFSILIFPLSAQSRIPKDTGGVTYDTYLGIASVAGSGSQDTVQVLFYEVDNTESDPFYLAIDSPGVISNTSPDDILGASPQTTVDVLGGSGALSDPVANDFEFVDRAEAISGATSLGSQIFTNETGWEYIGPFYPSDGEAIGNKYYFRIVISINADVDRNGYRLDVSYNNPGSGNPPSGSSSFRAFAYSWNIALLGDSNSDAAGGTDRLYELYPFVPEGAVAASDQIVFSNLDVDQAQGTGNAQINVTGSGYNLSNAESEAVSLGAVGASGNGVVFNSAYSISEDTGTWKAKYLDGEGMAGYYSNPAEFWHWRALNGFPVVAGTFYNPDSDGNVQELLRTYADYYVPQPPDHISLSLDDGIAEIGGTETVVLQVVDEAGNPVPYIRDIYVTVSGSGVIAPDITNPDGGLADTLEELLTTDSSGMATFTVTDAVPESVTITVTTDGSNSSDNLTNNVANDSGSIVFFNTIPPTISSTAGTTIDINQTAQAIGDILITDVGGGNLTTVNDIRLMIPSALSDTFFNNGATIGLTPTGTGTVGAADFLPDPDDGDENIILIPVTADFSAGDTLTITGLEVDTGSITGNGRIALSFDGGGTYNVIDDKYVSVSNLSLYTWLGTVDSSWNTGGNWDQGTVPGDTDDVKIKNTVNSPVLDINTANLGSLIIDSGASLDLSTYNLTVSGLISNNGTIFLEGTQTVSATMDSDSGLVVYDGNTDVTSLAAGSDYFDLEFNGTGTNWAINAALTVNGDLSVESGNTLDLGSDNLAVIGSISNNGIISLEGAQTFTATMDTDSGLVIFNGNAGATGLVAGYDYYDLEFSGAGAPTAWELGGVLTINNDLTISVNNEVDLAANDITVTGTFSNNGTLILDGTETLALTMDTDSGLVSYQGAAGGTLYDLADPDYFDLEIDSAGQVFVADGAITVANDLTVTAGTLSAVTNALTVAGASDLAGNITSSDGNLWLQGAVTLSGNAAVDSGAGAGDIQIDSTIDGAFGLTLDSGTGTVTLGGAAGAIGSGTSLTTLLIDGVSISSIPSIRSSVVEMNSTGAADITISQAGSQISSFAAAVANGRSILLSNNTASLIIPNGGTIVPGDISATDGTINIQNTGSITLTGDINAGTGTATLDTLSAAVIDGNGAIYSDVINLQTDASSSGFIGSFANNIETYSSGAAITTALSVGGGAQLSTYIDHQTGNLSLVSVNLGLTPAGFSLISSGLLTITGSPISVVDLNLESTGGALSIPASADLTASGTLDLSAGNGDLTISAVVTKTGAGTATISSSTGNISDSGAGYIVNSTGTTFLNAAGTIILDNVSNNIADLTIDTTGNDITLDYGNNSVLSAGAGDSFGNLTLGGINSAVFTLGTAIDINGDLNLANGTLDVDNTNDFQINLAGNWNNTGGIFNEQNGLVVLDGAGGGTVSSETYYNLEVSSGAGTYTLTGNLDVNDLSLTSGVLDVSASDFQINVAGNWSNSGATFNEQNGLVVFDGTGTIDAETFYDMEVNSAAGTHTLSGNLVVGNDITLTSGTLDVSATNYSVNVIRSWTNSGGTFIAQNGTVTFDGAGQTGSIATGGTGAGQDFYNLVINDGGGLASTWTLGNDTLVTNDLTVTDGTLDTSTFNLQVSGATALVDTDGTLDFSSSLIADVLNLDAVLDVNGTLLGGAGTIQASENVDFTGGAFTKGTGVFEFDGVAPSKTLVAAGEDLGDIDVSGLMTLNDTGDFDDVTVGGTFATGQNFTVAGDWNDSGTVTISGGTVTFDNAGAQSYTSNGDSFSNVQIGDGTNDSALTLNNDMTLTGSLGFGAAGGSAIDFSDDTLTIGGNGDFSAAGAVTTNAASLLLFNANGNQNFDPGGYTFGDVTKGGLSGTLSLLDVVTVSDTLTISAGTIVDMQANNFTVGTLVNDNVLQLEGTQGTQSITTMDVDTGQVEYDGVAGGTVRIASFYDLLIDGVGTFTLNSAIDVNNDLDIAGGTLDIDVANNYKITLGGDWINSGGTFNEQAGEVEFDGAAGTTSGAETFYDVRVSGVLTLGGALDVNRDLIITGTGTLDVSVSNFAITIGRTLTNSGTFIAQNGTVTFDGAGQTGSIVTGGTGAGQDFYNLVINDGGGLASTWTLGNDTLVTNDLTVTDGTLDTSAFNLQVSGATALVDTDGTLDFSSSLIADVLNLDAVLDVNGTLLGGAGTIQASENVDFTGGNFTKGAGVFEFDGIAPSKTLVAAGEDLGDIDVSGLMTLNDTGDFDDVTVGGTFATGQNFTVAGDWNDSGTVTISGGTVTFDNAGAQSYTSNGDSFSNVQIGDGTNDSALTLNNDMTLTGSLGFGAAGGSAIDFSDDTLTIGGNGDFSAAGAVTTNAASLLLFNANGNQNFDPGGYTFGDVTKGGLSGTLSLLDAVTVSDTLTISAGTIVDMQANNFTVGTLVNDNVLQLEGTQGTQSITTMDVDTGQVEYDGGAGGTVRIASFYDLLIDGVGTFTLNSAIDVNNDLDIAGGTLDIDVANNYKITLGGDWINSGGTFNEQAGEVEFDGAAGTTSGAETFYDVRVSGVLTLGGALDVNRDLIITGTGTLDVSVSNFAITIGRTLTNSGTFIAQNGTVTFDGAGQTGSIVTGGTGAGQDFYNLVINDGGGLASTWTLGNDTLVTNDLTVTDGTLDTSAFNLQVSGAMALVDTDGTLDFSSSLIADVLNLDAVLDVNGTLLGGAGTIQASENVDFTGGAFTKGTGVFEFDGVAPSKTLVAAGEDLGDIDVSGLMTLSDTGDFDDVTVSGTFATGQNFTVAGDWNDSGTVTISGGTVTFDNIGAQSYTSDGDSFSNVQIGDGTNDSALTLNNDMTLTGSLGFGAAGGSAIDFSDDTLTIGGNGDFSAAGAVTTNAASLLLFNANGNQNFDPGGYTFGDVTKGGLSGTLSLLDAVTVSDTLTISAGTIVDMQANNFTVGTLVNDNVLQLEGTQGTQSITTMDVDSGQVEYDGVAGGTVRIASFYDLLIDGVGTFTLNSAIDVNNDLDIAGGMLDVSGSDFQITLDGNWTNSDTFAARNGTVVFNDSSTVTTTITSPFYNVTLGTAGAGTLITSSDMEIDGVLSIINTVPTTLNIDSDTLTVAGHLDFSSLDTFVETNSTVVFDGAVNQNLTSSGFPFNNITISGISVTLQDITDVNGNMLVSTGTLIDNAQTISFFGDVDFTGGAFTATGTAVFDGNSAVTSNSQVFFNVTLGSTAAGSVLTTNDQMEIDGVISIQNIGNTTIDISGDSLLIDGDLDLTNLDTFTVAGSTVLFDGTANQDLTSNTLPFNNLELDGTSVTLLDPIDVNGNIQITNGTFDSGSQNMNIAGDWTDNGTFTHNNNRVIFDGTGSITTNETFYELEKAGGTTTLQAGSSALTIDKGLLLSSGILAANDNTITFSATADTFDSDGDGNAALDPYSGIFQYDTSTVVFQNPGTISIWGDNSFYNFSYQIAGGTILFGAGKRQTIYRNMTIRGVSGNLITLDSTNSPTQWELEIDFPSAGGSATATFEYVNVINSHAINPITPDTTCNDGGNNTNWFFFIAIVVSWAEDSDLNGRLDRIRVRVESVAILDDPNRFDDVTAWVDGYEVDTSYNSVLPYGLNGFSDSDNSIASEFFIHLVEKEYTDTDVTPQWRLMTNTSLFSTTGGALVEYGVAVPSETPIDNAAPIYNYTLSSSEKNKIYVQFSEYVRQPDETVIEAVDFSYGGAANISSLARITTSGTGTKELELTLDALVTADEILNGAILQIVNDIDDMDNWNDTWGTFAANYPSADPTAIPDLATGNVGDSNNPMIGGGTASGAHRVSDLALGLTGDAILQPVYATDESQTDPDRGGIGTIRDFTGGTWLQDQPIELTTHINSGHSAPSGLDPQVQLFFDVDVPSAYRQNNDRDGLWLPGVSFGNVPAADDYDIYDFYGIVPSPNPDEREATAGTSPSNQLRVHSFDNDDPELESVADVEFLYYLPAYSLFAARIENSSASDWYRQIKPWTFAIHDITTQVGGVTILKNVINPENGETTNLHYELAEAGMVTIQVFDISGAMVDVLQRGRQEAGEYSTAWDGHNSGGRIVARGVYFIRIVAPGIDETRKVMVVK